MPNRFYIQTRGKTVDYGFLCQEPDKAWWRSYGKYTSFEEPTLIIENGQEEEGGKFYLSGIPSERRDRVNTIIRYTVVAEFSKSEKKLISLVQQFLNETAEPRSISTLSSSFDKYFPREYVEEVLSSKEGDTSLLRQKFDLLLSELEANSPLTSEDIDVNEGKEGIWWGGLNNFDSRSRWMSFVSHVLQGQTGTALLLNLASVESLQELSREDRNMAFLIPESDRKPQKINIQAGKKTLWVVGLLILLILLVIFFILIKIMMPS